MTMMKCAILAAAVLLASQPAAATTQKFAAGWDNFGEPLNYAQSGVTWSLSKPKKTLTITYNLVGATPGKLYQVAFLTFNLCTGTPPAQIGQFPTSLACTPYTRQGVTASTVGVDIGGILTDAAGNGSIKIVLGPLASGVYKASFLVREGVGCVVAGGGSNCSIDFQSPGPFGTGTTIMVP